MTYKTILWDKKTITREDLFEELAKYRDILSDQAYDYLLEALNLSISSLKSNHFENLHELNIAREIMKYNITKRCENIFKNDKKYETSINTSYGLGVYLTEGTINKKLFTYIDNEDDYNNIHVYTYEDIGSLREDLIENAYNRLAEESKRDNPYQFDGRYGGPGANWIYNHGERIRKIKDTIEKLENNRNLPEYVKLLIEASNYYANLLESEFDYGLDNIVIKSNNPKTYEDEIIDEYITNYPNVKVIKKVHKI